MAYAGLKNKAKNEDTHDVLVESKSCKARFNNDEIWVSLLFVIQTTQVPPGYFARRQAP